MGSSAPADVNKIDVKAEFWSPSELKRLKRAGDKHVLRKVSSCSINDDVCLCRQEKRSQ